MKNYNESNLVSDEKKAENIKQAFMKSYNEQTAVDMVTTLSEELEKLRIKKSKLSGSYKLVEKVKEMAELLKRYVNLKIIEDSKNGLIEKTLESLIIFFNEIVAAKKMFAKLSPTLRNKALKKEISAFSKKLNGKLKQEMKKREDAKKQMKKEEMAEKLRSALASSGKLPR